MAAKTQQFQPSGSNIRSTIQQSINLIRGKDVSNYTLVFMDPTTKNSAGSHENIYMPHISLGRGKKCHVRYSEKYGTVSREHASISSDGNSVFINHNPNAKNPTLVNGNPISRAYSLQNGDEIQLSYDGPRIRFNTSKVKTSTIGLTSRIGGAISQAVKPYKTAISVLGMLLLVALGFAGYNMYQNTQLNEKLLDSQMVIESLSNESESLNNELKNLEQRGKANTARYRALARQKRQQDRQIRELKNNPKQVAHYKPTVSTSGKTTYRYDKEVNTESAKIDKKKEVDNKKFRANASSDVVDNLNLELPNINLLPKPDVVFLVGKKIKVSYKGMSRIIGVKQFYQFDQENPQFEDRDGIVYGTGFYTDSGELITARHVVQPWRYASYYNMKNSIWKELNALEANGAIITIDFDAYSPGGKEHAFNTSNVRIDVSKDRDITNKGKIKLKALIALDKTFKKFGKIENKYITPTERFSDWAKLSFSNVASSKISISRPKSLRLRTGTKLHILGYSYGNDMQTSRRKVESQYSPTIVSTDYTFDGIIQVSGLTFGPGASGGPAMIYENGKFIAVGIVSAAVGATNAIIVPLQNVR